MIDNLLKRIKYSYGLNLPCNDLIEEYFKTNNSSDLFTLQQNVIDFILNDKTLCVYQPYMKYKRNFLKTIINLVEKQNEEVNEDLFNSYISLLNDKQFGNQEKYFVVFFAKNNQDYDFNDSIIIEQHSSIISKGTTGLYIWPACYFLIEFLKENKILFENKVILEIGTGLGLLGLNCLKLNPKQYIFTDSHIEVLNQLKKNLNYNYNESKIGYNGYDSNKTIILDRLDWCDLNECDLLNNKISFDIILASDIIFDPDIIPSLVETLNKLWRCNMFMIISSTIRNESTYNLFLNKLKENNFSFEVLNRKIASDKDEPPIEILKIHK